MNTMPVAHGLSYSCTRPNAPEVNMPLVLLPGFPGGRAGVAWLVERLAQDRVVLAVDALGGAEGDVPEPTGGEYRFEVCAERLVRLMADLGIERAELIGLSLGGVWAQYVLAKHSARFERATLVGTCARMRARERAWALHVLAQLKSDLPLPEIARAAALQQFSPAFLRRPAALLLIDRFVRQTAFQRAGFVGQFLAMLAHDSRALLPQCACQVKVVVGALDGVFPVDLSEELVRLLPSAQLEVLPALGHCVWIEAPELCLRLFSAGS
jgi:3-oxoadipate enol-lactonase